LAFAIGARIVPLGPQPLGLHGLSSRQLQAFYEVAQTLNFNRAAQRLNLSQPAVSQRIAALERQLGQRLLRREGGVVLTEAGRRLLRYCHLRETFEKELIHDLRSQAAGCYGGAVRIAGFSSVMRSVIMPVLNENLLRRHPDVTPHFAVDEMYRLPGLLLRGSVDFSLTQFPLNLSGVVSVEIGLERNVLVESARHARVPEVYIDHEPDDHFTEQFIARQQQVEHGVRRAFYDDIYGLLDAVVAGMGKAVLPAHLIQPEHQLRPTPGFASMDVPVVLNYFQAAGHSRLHRAVIDALVRHAPVLLDDDRCRLQQQTGRPALQSGSVVALPG
jgi:DNA-binding transcriptional LysR family regulator